MLWEQSARLVRGARIWDRLRARGGRVGILFWQQSLGEAADMVLSPAPIHKHHGGMIQDCYSQPSDLYAQLTRAVGRPFDLSRYWGPLAGASSTAWIVTATQAVLALPQAPDLLLVYLPHLDYDLQRFGPESPRAFQALDMMYAWLSNLWKTAREAGRDVLIFGDYAIEPITGPPIFPNRALREAGLFQARSVRGRLYHDLHASAAFAMADHQTAELLILDPDRRDAAIQTLEQLDGVDAIRDLEGRLIAVARPGRWFAYPWWNAAREAPDFARHVDIHSKPGYDPCELFFGWPPPSVCQNPARLRGTHGRIGPDMDGAWACSWEADGACETLPDLARMAARKLEP